MGHHQITFKSFYFQKSHQFSQTVQCCTSVFTLCLTSCLFKTSPSPLNTLWLVGSHTPEPVQLAVSPVSSVVLNYANVWPGDAVWCQEITGLKAGLLTRCFRSSVFCGRRSVCWCAITCIIHWREGKQWKVSQVSFKNITQVLFISVTFTK